MQPITVPNLASPAFKADPYPFYARLRAEAPVFRTILPDKQVAWLITRYEDVASVLKDERFSKDRLTTLAAGQRVKTPWIPGFAKPLARNMLDVDGPDHTRLRALVHTAFTPRLIERLRERIHRLTDELLAAAERKGGLELVADFALPLPITIIAEMLGVPVQDRHRFHRWTNKVVAVSSGRDALTAIPSIWACVRYMRKLIKARRAAPRDDLISALIQAQEAGDSLSEDELLAMVFLLLIAGHETTVNLIASGALALMQFPEQAGRLRQDPALSKTAVEELLRFTSPVQMATERYAREDIKIAGTTIPRGDLVFAVIASANRDERQFDAPDTLEITRDLNRHLSFGQGMHYCLGAPLARLEGQIALPALLQRYPKLRLKTPNLQWRRGLILRGLEQLPLAI